MEEEIIMEEQNSMMFNEWLSQIQAPQEIWEFRENTVLGLSRSLIELLNQIIEYLNDIHERDSFNGDLLNNLRICRTYLGLRLTWKVEFVSNPPLNLIEPIHGIIADVQHFRQIVYQATERFHLGEDLYPPACLLFFQIVYDFNPQCGYYDSLSYVKRIAFYNYSHPLFFNKVRMTHFIYKVYEIQKRNPFVFNQYICLDNTTPLTDMGFWLDRIPLDPDFQDWEDRQPPLRQVLYYPRHGAIPPYQFQTIFLQSYGVIKYLRTVCEHARDVIQNAWSGKILNELYRVLPDALPKIHFLMCAKFDDDKRCQDYLSARNIGKLMRHGPFGYKGLKF